MSADTVTIARKRGLLLLAALIPLGVATIVLPFVERGYRDLGRLFIALGMLLIVLGIGAALNSPLASPSSVRVTSDGVRWGSRRIPAASISSVSVTATAQPTRHGLRFDWFLSVNGEVFPVPRIRLAFGPSPAMPPDVEHVATAIHALLGKNSTPPMTKTEKEKELSQWGPEGSAPAELTEPLTEPMWREHLETGRVIERARYGNYLVVAIDTAGAARVMKYRYRLFVLPAEGQAPVLAVNHEVSPFGTACYGTHRGSRHTNFGEAPAELRYEEFRARAREILAEELLGIPAG